jgi:REP element-mobilizing transposase RayT
MPDRKHLRRLEQTWTRCPRYFLTLCTANRRRILTAPHAAQILAESWQAAPRVHEWMVGRYVIIPDHVHFFAAALSDRKPLSAFVRDWKKWTARRFQLCGISLPPVWQLEFFDHVLRSTQSYEEKWAYVRENPVRAGLVSSDADWPFAGECGSLDF